jgi:hypothetical protein
MTSELEKECHDPRWKLFLRRRHIGGCRITGGDGLLSLPLLSLVVKSGVEHVATFQKTKLASASIARNVTGI